LQIDCENNIIENVFKKNIARATVIT